MREFKLGKIKIGEKHPVYFIADIAANHDGSLKRAIKLIRLAAKSGANAAKFQHFRADTIVSDIGFKKLGSKLSHQKTWKKSIFETYKDASINLKWTAILKKECNKLGIEFFSTPYSFQLVDHINKYIKFFKIGSGDISWHDLILYVAKKKKPLIIATRASSLKEVDSIVKKTKKINNKIVLMQCNTNYTAKEENFNFINLNVLIKYKKKFPNLVLGLSDHTLGHETVLGAVALGARVIEKHFTDNNNRVGPDHAFSMNPSTWEEMVKRTRNLEKSFGDGIKKIEKNEIQSSVVQRRSIRAKSFLKKGTKLTSKMLVFLRPCPKGSIHPYETNKIIGKITKRKILKGDVIKWQYLK